MKKLITVPVHKTLVRRYCDTKLPRADRAEAAADS
jgi:hypothetical protein